MTTFITAAQLDRCHADRDDPAANEARWTSPEARVLVIDEDCRVAVDGDGRLSGVPTQGERDDQRHFLLGLVDGRPWFTLRGPITEPSAPAGGDGGVVQLRSAELGPADRELAWAGLATLTWHESMPACPRCHGSTRATSGGPARVCVLCGHVVFPRTDPAIITAVLDDDDRIVLARQGRWAPGRVSVLAGFVEAGEAAEHAVAREVAEETGVQVQAARYVVSQPWPFPRSLMLAFVSRGTGPVRVDGEELVEGAWYRRDEVRDLLARGEMTLPGPMSVARLLIDSWLSGRLPSPESGVDLTSPASRQP